MRIEINDALQNGQSFVGLGVRKKSDINGNNKFRNGNIISFRWQLPLDYAWRVKYGEGEEEDLNFIELCESVCLYRLHLVRKKVLFSIPFTRRFNVLVGGDVEMYLKGDQPREDQWRIDFEHHGRHHKKFMNLPELQEAMTFQTRHRNRYVSFGLVTTDDGLPVGWHKHVMEKKGTNTRRSVTYYNTRKTLSFPTKRDAQLAVANHVVGGGDAVPRGPVLLANC